LSRHTGRRLPGDRPSHAPRDFEPAADRTKGRQRNRRTFSDFPAGRLAAPRSLKASLVTAETVGRERIYRVNPGRLHPVHDWISRAIADPSGHVWAFKAKSRIEKGN